MVLCFGRDDKLWRGFNGTHNLICLWSVTFDFTFDWFLPSYARMAAYVYALRFFLRLRVFVYGVWGFYVITTHTHYNIHYTWFWIIIYPLFIRIQMKVCYTYRCTIAHGSPYSHISHFALKTDWYKWNTFDVIQPALKCSNRLHINTKYQHILRRNRTKGYCDPIHFSHWWTVRVFFFVYDNTKYNVQSVFTIQTHLHYQRKPRVQCSKRFSISFIVHMRYRRHSGIFDSFA